MRTSTFCRCLFYRSLLGCGFLFLVGAGPVWAQREVEVQLSGGASLTRPAINRYSLPYAFRTPSGFNTAAALSFTLPLNERLGLSLEQRVTGLNQSFAYRLGGSQQSTGIMSRTVHQSGIGLRLYDLWAPTPHWGLDVGLTGSYGWTSGGDWQLYEGPLFFGTPSPSQPRRGVPVINIRETNRRGAPMVGAETVLRYEWGLRNTLLLTATYQRGLRWLGELRSTQVNYLDAAGAVQQGRFVVSSYGSYGSVQLGYGLRLGAIAATHNRHPTPRYSIDDAEDATDDSPIN